LHSDAVGIGSAFTQKLRSKAFLLIKQSQEQVLGSNVSVGQPFRLVCCEFQNALRGGTER
jgi:hypothetical protein